MKNIDNKAKSSAYCFFSLAFVVPVVLFLCTVHFLGVNVPYWDDYDAILAFANLDTADQWRNLFAYHNEHRIALTRLVTMAMQGVMGTINFKAFMWIGDLLFLTYVFLLGHRFGKSKAGIVAFIPFVWLLLDLINYENSIWAMTSVQNQGVLLFAFLSVWLLKKGQTSVIAFIGSLVAASIATITSGSGILIWPCLVVESIWIEVRDGREKKNWMRAALVLALGIAEIALYMSTRPEVAAEGGMTLNAIRIVLFGLTFLGGIVPFVSLALAIGFVLLGFLFWIARNCRKLESIDVAAFLLFLLGSMGAAAVCRGSGGLSGALGMRYNIVTVSSVACIFLLFRETIPEQCKIWRPLVGIAICGAVLVSVALYVYGWPLQVVRRDKIVNGMEQYLTNGTGELLYPEDSVDRARSVLDESLKKRVYSPNRRCSLPQPASLGTSPRFSMDDSAVELKMKTESTRQKDGTESTQQKEEAESLRRKAGFLLCAFCPSGKEVP